MLRWCEKNSVGHIVGLARNSRIIKEARPWIEKAEKPFERTGRKQKVLMSIPYAAGSWDRKRRVIVKAEHGSLGRNPRFVVTKLTGSSKMLYEKVYCAREDMENRIKEQQLELFADRTRSSSWWPTSSGSCCPGWRTCSSPFVRVLPRGPRAFVRNPG